MPPVCRRRATSREPYDNIIAIIGDGSLSGGEAFEGLDEASELGTGIIIVVNDNEMSIAENHGGILDKNLRALRQSNGTCSSTTGSEGVGL